MSAPVGSRVGVLYAGDNDTKVIKMLGYGVRAPDEVPNDEAGGYMAAALREARVPNPCLVLDNGDRVYGCECWWGAEKMLAGQVEAWVDDGWTVETVRIADMRAVAKGAA